MHPLDAEGTRTQVVRGESKRKRAAHKQGLQRALASINQLRKEREEFAFPPASVRAREGERGGGNWICSQESWHGWEREWEGDFQRKKGEAVSWMAWIEQGWRKRKQVGEGVVGEEREVWKVFLKQSQWYDGPRPKFKNIFKRRLLRFSFLLIVMSAVLCFHGCTVKYRRVTIMFTQFVYLIPRKRWMQMPQTVTPIVFRFAWESTTRWLYLPTALCLIGWPGSLHKRRDLNWLLCCAVLYLLSTLGEIPWQTSWHQ